jgi:hypothetical protein
VLDHATGEIGGDSHVEYAARAVGHDIDPAAFGFALHGARLCRRVPTIKRITPKWYRFRRCGGPRIKSGATKHYAFFPSPRT